MRAGAVVVLRWMSVDLVAVVLVRMLMNRFRWLLPGTTGKADINLHGSHTAAIHRRDVDGDLRSPQAAGKASQPAGRGPCGNEGAKQHVSTDSGDRIEDGKASIGQRLRNMPAGQEGWKEPALSARRPA